MSRHAHDDFSFLPTVDSTDEEVVEKEELISEQNPTQPERTETVHKEAAELIAAEETVHEEPLHQEPVYEEAVSAPPEPPVFVQVPQPAKKVRVFEPDAEHPSPEGERISQDRPKEPELPSAKVQPPKQPTDLPKLEDAALPIPRAPEALRKGVAPEDKLSVGPAASVPSESDAEPSDESKAVKDPKPFIAPKPPPEEPLDPEQAKKLRWQKLADKIGLRTLGMSFGVHLFLLLIAAFIGVSQVMDQQVDFLPGGSSPQSQAAAAELTHKIQNKKNPWLKAKPPMRKITVQTLSSNIVMPEMPAMDMMDFSKVNDRMDLNKAPKMASSQPAGMGMGGAGGGFGAGIGTGGKFSFVGQTAVGRRVVFVVDVSGSMSQPLKGDGPRVTRFELLKKELIKAVRQIPYGTAYQVLYFSDFAWAHNQVDTRKGETYEKYQWEIKSDTYKEVKIPTFKYIQASPFSLQESADLIQKADNPGLTNWGSGLLMALNASPKPDVIFFMTDGERQDENGWIDVVTAVNKSKLPMTVINTSVMAQVDAAREMDALAKRNNGTFSVIVGEGKVIKGEDFFKMK
ncbi:MAG: VWA domain-containing protein [Prosthecobacter sp.]|uniref:VWA domain-containing protein n=1 Tax=Prosthecobacter sp. TaxID=1965333 RepID=UPI0025E87AA9|nr:VWA domain-containing protein [Prosthecobacter sp.]MCF7785815.1 VWA domain-containing protein [Prosthecobacter sp.]